LYVKWSGFCLLKQIFNFNSKDFSIDFFFLLEY
jgi:hypothetical protein